MLCHILLRCSQPQAGNYQASDSCFPRMTARLTARQWLRPFSENGASTLEDRDGRDAAEFRGEFPIHAPGDTPPRPCPPAPPRSASTAPRSADRLGSKSSPSSSSSRVALHITRDPRGLRSTMASPTGWHCFGPKLVIVPEDAECAERQSPGRRSQPPVTNASRSTSTRLVAGCLTSSRAGRPGQQHRRRDAGRPPGDAATPRSICSDVCCRPPGATAAPSRAST